MNITHRAFASIKPSGNGGKVASWKDCGKELNRIFGAPKFKWKVQPEVDWKGRKTGKMIQIFERI